jgi:sec-independent protein translocase protein TatA
MPLSTRPAMRYGRGIFDALRPRNPAKLGHMSLGPMELILIVFIVLLLFGASRLPKMGRGLGQGLRGFKHELTDGLEGDEDAEDRRDREAVPRVSERQ